MTVADARGKIKDISILVKVLDKLREESDAEEVEKSGSYSNLTISVASMDKIMTCLGEYKQLIESKIDSAELSL